MVESHVSILAQRSGRWNENVFCLWVVKGQIGLQFARVLRCYTVCGYKNNIRVCSFNAIYKKSHTLRKPRQYKVLFRVNNPSN